MLEKMTFDALPSLVGEISEKLNLVLAMVSGSNKTQVNESDNNPIDITEASRILMVSKPTLYRYCNERKIRFYKQAKKLYFLRKDLNEFILFGRRQTSLEIQRSIIPQNKK